jgi:hypothetical protein
MPDLDYDDSLRRLADAWQQAAEHWHDDVARQFETHHWSPLLSEVHAYQDALDRLLNVLNAAESATDLTHGTGGSRRPPDPPRPGSARRRQPGLPAR